MAVSGHSPPRPLTSACSWCASAVVAFGSTLTSGMRWKWLQGGAPDGVEFVDVEEEYVVDEQGRGSWRPARPLAKPAPKAPRQKKERKVPFSLLII